MCGRRRLRCDDHDDGAKYVGGTKRMKKTLLRVARRTPLYYICGKEKKRRKYLIVFFSTNVFFSACVLCVCVCVCFER